jgi:hypothetical protein
MIPFWQQFEDDDVPNIYVRVRMRENRNYIFFI